MAGVTIKIQGLERLKNKFGSIPHTVITKMDAEMSAIAREYENRAASAAPKDRSEISRGITSEKKGEMKHEIVSQAPHAAYIEFGTKRHVNIPADLQQYAAQFKGKGGGNGKGFFEEIKAWVKRKGIDEDAAFPIYISIIRNGIHSQPYFFPQLPWAKEEMVKRPKEIINNALKK